MQSWVALWCSHHLSLRERDVCMLLPDDLNIIAHMPFPRSNCRFFT
jgi:hypothetical protein